MDVRTTDHARRHPLRVVRFIPLASSVASHDHPKLGMKVRRPYSTLETTEIQKLC